MAALRGEAAQAARLFGAAAALLDRLGAPLRPAVQANDEAMQAPARAALGPDAFAAAWAEGAALPLARAIAEAAGVAAAEPATIPVARSTHGLSARELEVLRLAARGLTDQEVADQLSISRRTVSQHLRSVYNKLDAPSRTAAAHLALERGLL